VHGTIVDAGFLVALFDRRDNHHGWAVAQASRLAPPWATCEAALAEAFYLLQPSIRPLISLLRRGEMATTFDLSEDLGPVLALMEKYADAPMSLADACLVRMTELREDSIILTTDAHFRVYRRHTRQAVPCILPID
jgi:predicted nucleic acid-binding protein